MRPGGSLPSPISPSATTTPMAGPLAAGFWRDRYSRQPIWRKVLALESSAPRSISIARSSSRVLRPSTSRPSSASRAVSPCSACRLPGNAAMPWAMAASGSLRAFSTPRVYRLHSAS